MEALARRILKKPLEITVGGKSVVCNDVTQEVIVLTEADKFLKLLELLGRYQEKGSVIVFVHKHEVADALLKESVILCLTFKVRHTPKDRKHFLVASRLEIEGHSFSESCTSRVDFKLF